MKLSLNLIKEFVNLKNASPDEVAEKLGFLGFEVAELSKKEYKLDERITAVLVKVVKPHPNADKLKICSVTDGQSEYEIVCGAPNVYAGMLALLAKEGAVLPNNVTIKPAVLRGVTSNGMLCSASELGLWEDHSGIVEVEQDVTPGTTASSLLPKEDSIIDLELTANRPDCLSHIGIARELASVYKENLKFPEICKNINKSSLRKVSINNSEMCKRYYAVYFENVKVGPAPLWMRLYLNNCGIRSINNIVDITNYVLIELGHPLHAFDQKCVEGGEISVRSAFENEEITALDGKNYKLDPSVLVIADKVKPIAIAGIMGGEYSSIVKGTSAIVLESAFFKPVAVRRASRKLGLSSQSSVLFERGTDIENVYFSSRRAAFLIEKYAGASISAFEDHYPDKAENISVTLRHDRVEKILGMKFEPRQNIELLSRLGLELASHNENFSVLKVPSYRFDIKDEIDLIEEIARVSGYDKIQPRLLIDFVQPEITKVWEQEYAAADILSKIGFYEVKNYSFINEKVLNSFLLPQGDARRDVVTVKNPVSQEYSLMSSFLLPNLMAAVKRNVNQQNNDIRFFEISKCFTRANAAPVEKNQLAGVLYQGEVTPCLFEPKPKKIDFYYLSGLMELFFSIIGLKEYSLKPPANPYSHPGESVGVDSKGAVLGEFGKLHPAVSQDYKLDGDIFYFEFDFDALNKSVEKVKKFVNYSRYPSVKRDISLIFDEQTRWQEVKSAVESASSGIAESVNIFDIYRGPQTGNNKKNMSFSVTFRAMDKTLTDKEADSLRADIVKLLSTQFKAQIRE